MALQLISPDQWHTQAWKNGGGITHQLARSDDNAGMRWRVSIAEVASDGAFSRFEQTDRIIMLLQGKGFCLHGAEDQPIVLDKALLPFAFAGETAQPSDAAAAVWDRVAAALASGPAWRARVQGHSDASTANNEGAAALAAQRALSLRDALVQRGLPSAALDVEAWGARAPRLPNDTPEGRAGNRRVEIWVTD